MRHFPTLTQPAPLLGCIADDFTGATDVATFSVRGGKRAMQTIGVPWAESSVDAHELVGALKSRMTASADAVERSLSALSRLQAQGCRQFCFRYCSTFDSPERGNIGPVDDALLEALGKSFAIACPAVPENDRTVFRGTLFKGDCLINELGMQTHPLTPKTDLNIVRVLQAQTKSKATAQVALVQRYRFGQRDWWSKQCPLQRISRYYEERRAGLSRVMNVNGASNPNHPEYACYAALNRDLNEYTLSKNGVLMNSSNPIMNSLRHIVVLGVGGTIAATAESATQTHDYKLTGTLMSVLERVPQLAEIADISGERVANISSQEVDNTVLLRLARIVNARLSDPTVDGLVITHGTDTLEESAYFLHLLVKSGKPIVMTGAMRPASALSADGPLNLYNAVRVAIDDDAYGKGVLVVLDERVVSARHVTKMHTSATDAFSYPEAGMLGSIRGGRVTFHALPIGEPTDKTDFAVNGIDSLPPVDIVYGYQNAGTHFFTAAIDAGARGIVFAATGNGTLSEAAKAGALMAREHGVAVVRSSRVAGGGVSQCSDDFRYDTIAAQTLNPQKARILLMLGLARRMNTQALRRYFELYG